MERLERTVLQYIKQQQLVVEGDRVLIACSGGVDSMALLYFFMKMRQHLQIHIAAVHVDHMLRGEVSDGDRRFVEAFCRQHQIECFSRAIDIPAILREEGGNSQAICRRERYAYFEELLAQHHFTKLVTAHHADDQLESMLMALTKGSTINGLKGMAPSRKILEMSLIRPFLMVTKDEIREYLQLKNEDYREDASNAKNDYTRNRFRHFILPALKEENPQVSLNALNISAQLQQDDELLMSLAKSRFFELFQKSEEQQYIVKIQPFLKEPLALQRRLILILLNYLYGDSNTFQSHALIKEILKLYESQQGSAIIHLPEGFIARRQYSEVIFEKQTKAILSAVQQVKPNIWLNWHGIQIFVGEIAKGIPTLSEQAQCYYFHAKDLAWPLVIRARQTGDRITQKGMEHHKKVSRIFIDEKIPSAKRDCWPLLVNAQNDVLAVLGVRVNHTIAKQRRPDDDYVIIVKGLL